MKKLTLTLTSMLLAASTGLAAHAMDLPLKEMEGIADRDHWLPGEVNKDGALEALQAATGGAAEGLTVAQDKPLQIALIYPSADTSDFWARNYLALTKRLDEIGIQYETREFASRQIEHSLQATYATCKCCERDSICSP